MRWRTLAAALVLLRAGTALASPFDTYQLLMWQERTPAQLAGLERLGFTGTKLRATGGVVDPAELAAHVASGLPWFLENIATDFYAPYHRYTPGKSVTWLFDDAKARRRRDPADETVFERQPSLSDPAWRRRVDDRLQALVAAQRRYHPLYYNLADEAGIGDLAAAWDADLSPPAQAAFRAWLRTRYPSLPALNQVWGTNYPSWDAVRPMLTDAALARTDDAYAAWNDFKTWMDLAFAQAVRAGTDALHAADPAALSGLEGGQLPGWGGYDYFQLAPAVDVMEIYDEANNVAIARAAHPGMVLLRTSFGAGDIPQAWRNLLQGGRGTIVWDESDQIVAPDGSPLPRGAELARFMAQIGPVAPIVIASTPARDPVAVLVSQASFRLQWLLDRRPGGPAWSDRSAGREYEDNAWRAARREALQRLAALGIEPHLISSAMLEAGVLAGIRVLILPDAIALSDREVAAIRAFKDAGGTILADTEPGLYDGHLRRRPQAPLADIAPVSEAIIRRGIPPDPSMLDGESALLEAAGVVPRAVLRDPAGNRATNIEIRWLQHGPDLLMSVQATAPYAAAPVLTIDLAAPATLRDLRRPSGPAAVQRFTLPLDPAEPAIVSLSR